MEASKQPPNPYQVRAAIFQKYETLIQDGKYTPLTSSSFSWGLFLLFLFFLIPPTSQFHNRLTRYLVFAIVLSWHVYLVTNFKARSLAVSFGAGISSAWGTLWAASVLVFKDAKVDFKRVEQRNVQKEKVGNGQNESESGERAHRSPRRLRKMHDESDLRRRAAEASSDEAPRVLSGDATSSRSLDGLIQSSGPDSGVQYIWQSYPLSTFWHRLRWVADILTNFRGVGWNWRISGLPSLPPHVQASLAQSSKDNHAEIKDIATSHSGLYRHDTVDSLVRHNVYLLVIGYLLIDALKTTMNHDAYFFTGDPSTPPPSWLAPLLNPFPVTLTHIITTSYRLLTTMTMVWLCLRTIFTLAPLTFSALLSRQHSPLLRIPYLNSLAFFAANGEPWLYPDAFGAYSNVFSRGLAGWWGQWWHSIFRYAFQASGEFAATLLGIDGKGKGQLGRAVQVAVAFFVSGCIHASGSVTMVAETKAWKGSFMFFLSQIVGVLAEALVRGLLKKKKKSGNSSPSSSISSRNMIPRTAGYLLNFLWVHAWFYWTAPLLVDDFARSGLWTFEPLAVSLFRGLGFGVQGDGWWCLGGERVWWHRDERWWLSGVAF